MLYHSGMHASSRGKGHPLSNDTHDAQRPGARLSVALLQAENQRLRARLDAVMHEARLNQDKMRRFDLLERKVIGADSLTALVRTLLVDYKALFELDAVTLALVDPLYEVAQMLESQGAGELLSQGLQCLDSERRLQGFYTMQAAMPVLSGLAAEHAFLFEDAASHSLASVALLPLVHHGKFMGSLNLGSQDAQRFVAGSSTDFLQRLASLVAVCLESALATERLKQAGLTDILTGVHNRRYFESRCLEEVTSARRSGAPLVGMILDVDKFKNINDTLGHPTGDEVLRYVARLIKAQLRGSDMVARYGGEEFVVLLPATPQEAGLEIAERIRRVVAAQTVPVKSRETVRVSISIGVTLLTVQPEATEAADAATLMADMMARADKALYEAKEGGRNRVVVAVRD